MREYIPIDKCKDGWLYQIDARNSSLGICKDNGKSFTISRTKFKDNYLFDEDHWDTGEPWGTVSPLRIIERAPAFKDDTEKLAYLNKKLEEIFEKDYIDFIPTCCGKLMVPTQVKMDRWDKKEILIWEFECKKCKGLYPMPEKFKLPECCDFPMKIKNGEYFCENCKKTRPLIASTPI
jgi:hypothetical protein